MAVALLASGTARAAEATEEESDAASAERSDTSARPWYLPDYINLQFAGGIGFVSAGVGYRYWQDRLSTGLSFGFTPRSAGGEDISTLALKQTLVPFTWEVSPKAAVRPIGVGLYLSYTFGEEYFLILPDHYPDRYYLLPTALHLGVFLTGDAALAVEWGAIQRLEVYYEIGSNESEIALLAVNPGYLDVFDILSLAFGVRVAF